ncbi:hypothetical protein CPB83DRAFT_861487 [Crepidotus variabilis]|uniref:DUF6534 domain-containing protein n=1 Tax=Crepidotus variabilis TaxID=179855 RepID=A0A9P6E820_9AGAR|nr:hypothetical protein CPB83DRAFT_861487 [Crepidotus variabilis]
MGSSTSFQSVINSSLGAVFVGFGVSCIAFGVLVSQMASYFKNFPGDKTLFKFLVVSILLLQTADQMFIGHIVYFYAISNYANPLALVQSTTTWSFLLQLLCGAIAGAVVKSYFGFRVWRFSNRNYWITGLILFLTLGQLALALVFTVEAFKLPSVFEVHKLQTLGTISLGVGVLTDVVTAGALCIFLNRLRTGLSSSDSLVKSLVRYAVNTGALTSTLSVSVVLLYNVLPTTNLAFVACYFVLSKLYAISFLATLNTRRSVRGSGTDHQGNTDNNTNMFALGTRLPSMGPSDLDQWDKVDPPLIHQEKLYGQPLPILTKMQV